MTKLAMLAAAAAVLSALSARAEQKNVQLLTNMSDVQLQRTMNMMRGSLGVHCDFCHVVDDKNGWQWDKDDKKEKKVAREMIALTQKINKEQFNGRTEVSCWTCHRGATHPAALVSLPQPAPPFPTPKQERPTLPALDEVIKKYATALRDVALLAQPRTMRGTRETFEGKPVPIEVQQSGARVHIAADTPTGRVEQTVNEMGGWSKDKDGVHEFPASGLENFREIASSLDLTLPSAIPADARVIGKETIGNREALIVAWRPAEGVRERLYIDNNTGYLLRRVMLKETPIGNIPQQTDFEDWRNVGTAIFPHLIRTSLVDPWAGSTRRYAEVKLGAKIDESVFAKPK